MSCQRTLPIAHKQWEQSFARGNLFRGVRRGAGVLKSSVMTTRGSFLTHVKVGDPPTSAMLVVMAKPETETLLAQPLLDCIQYPHHRGCRWRPAGWPPAQGSARASANFFWFIYFRGGWIKGMRIGAHLWSPDLNQASRLCAWWKQ